MCLPCDCNTGTRATKAIAKTTTKAAAMGVAAAELPQHLIFLNVLTFVPVLGRVLSVASKEQVDLSVTKQATATDEDKKTEKKEEVPQGTVPVFPLSIRLSRYASFGNYQLRVDYKLDLKQLLAKKAEIVTSTYDPTGAADEDASSSHIYTEDVQRVYSELAKLRHDEGVRLCEDGREHFEVDVEDALGRVALHHVYKYRFPKTPVDDLLTVLLTSADEEEDF